MSNRQIQVRGTDHRIVVGVGVLTGIGLALDGLQPTGSAPVDWLLLISAATAAVWASASAPWWALSGLAAIGTALAPPIVAMAVAGGVFVLSLGVGLMKSSQPPTRAVVAGASLLSLAIARDVGAFGVTTMIAVLAATTVAVLGVTRRSRRVRRRVWQAAAALAGLVALGALGLLAGGVAGRPDLTQGNRTARAGLRALKSGDFDTARSSFSQAAGAFERAEGDLTAPWTLPARLVPIAAQHGAAGAEISSGAADATRRIEQQLALVDLDSLRIVDGRIDLDAVRGLAAPMAALQAALDDLDRTVVDSDSAWLARPIRRRLADLTVEIDEQQALGSKAVAALDVAPTILGADGERLYFVMFTTPAEARGQGGFMGNWAELSFDNGRIAMTSFGRTAQLSRGGDRPRVVTGPVDWLARYGQFGFQAGPDRVVGEVPWSNITVSPNFPSTAQVVAELYPQSGGRRVDGVISLDVEALGALVGLVGPIQPSSVDVALTGANTAQFLSKDQYEINAADRVDLLETVARDVLNRVVSGDIADPLDLGRALAGPAREGRLMAWSQVADEQQVIANAGMDGALFSDLDSSTPNFSFRVANAAPNKIDAYLEREICVSTDGPVTAEVTLINRAPARGLPPVVIGNRVDLPDGFNRSYVTWFSTSPVAAVSVDGESVGVGSQIEVGVHASSLFVDVPPGDSVVLTFEMSESLRPLTTFGIDPQPLVLPESWAFGCDTPVYRPVSTPTVIPTR